MTWLFWTKVHEKIQLEKTGATTKGFIIKQQCEILSTIYGFPTGNPIRKINWQKHFRQIPQHHA